MSISGIFSIGLSGVNAFATSLEAVSNNIANSQTIGYKRVQTDFSDLVTQNAPELNEAVGTGVTGTGVSAAHRQLVTEQGAVTRTNNATDLAVAGDGFFVVSETADANPANSPFLYTRSGGFRPDAAGNLVNEAGYFLRGATTSADGTAAINGGLNSLDTVNINRAPPLSATEPSFGALTGIGIEDGFVIGSYANGASRALFEIPLALFVNANGLEEGSDTTFRTTPDTGDLSLTRSGEGRAGVIESAALEISTVDIGQEFSTLIATQRAYSSNARVIAVADELWRTVTETAA